MLITRSNVALANGSAPAVTWTSPAGTPACRAVRSIPAVGSTPASAAPGHWPDTDRSSAPVPQPMSSTRCGATPSPTGTLESKSGFRTRKEAEGYGADQEAAIRAGTYVDRRAGSITLTEWVNQWFPALDLELNTLSTYRYTIEVHILPKFGDRTLVSLTPEEIAVWEKQVLAKGYTRRTAREARSTLATILADAIPRYIQSNPAARRRGKGRKGQRRIERAEKAERTWATALEVLLFAERCSALSGRDADFVLVVPMAYTGMRWSEAMGLAPSCVRRATVKVDWKLYERDARFYRGRPKDGSIRTVDVPPFLADLLAHHLAVNPATKCTCRNSEEPWCPGGEYVFLGPRGVHFRRSNYAVRTVRPAADGRYAGRNGRCARPAAPVLVDASAPWPGTPLSPRPAVIPGEPYAPPTGRGIPRVTGKDGNGRCAACGRSTVIRADGTVISHKIAGALPRLAGRAGRAGPGGELGAAVSGADPRMGCGTVTRPGWMRWASGTCCSRSAWGMRSPACAASTATSRHGCAKS